MSDYQLIHDYKNDRVYRESFNDLAKLIFEIDFSKWYEKGCWIDNYICYSYIDGDQVIANASVNIMTVLNDGKEYRGIQIGTVMTHPNYRHQDLAKRLMNHIIDEYEDTCDFIYLFANETVLDFYPKFGFTRVEESNYFLNIEDLTRKDKKNIRKLKPEYTNDFDLMTLYSKERMPVSSVLGVKNNEHLLMFYFLVAFPDSIYFIEGEDAIVLFEEEEGELHLFDVISRKEVDLETILNSTISTETRKIIFHYIAEHEKIEVNLKVDEDDVLFVRPKLPFDVKETLFPLTSHS